MERSNKDPYCEISVDSDTPEAMFSRLSRPCSELDHLPSLSQSDPEESKSLTADDVQKIIEASRTINDQVKLRLSQFLTKSILVTDLNTAESIMKPLDLSKDITMAAKTPNQSLLTHQNLEAIKDHQQYLLKLLDQLNLLHSEVELSYSKIKAQEDYRDLIQKTPPPCCLDKCSVSSNISCSCYIF